MNYELRITNWRKVKAARVIVAAGVAPVISILAFGIALLEGLDSFQAAWDREFNSAWEHLVKFVREGH